MWFDAARGLWRRRYELSAGGGISGASNSIKVDLQTLTGVSTVLTDDLPDRAALDQSYPNPFNPSTKIGFRVSGLGSSWVKLSVYDVLGREVAVLVNETKEHGYYQTTWNASGFPSGVYICRMMAGDFVGTRKMLLLK
jgi:hypothetical protein